MASAHMNMFSVFIIIFICGLSAAAPKSGDAKKGVELDAQNVISLTASVVEYSDTHVLFNVTGPRVYHKFAIRKINLTIKYRTVKDKKTVWVELTEGFNVTYTKISDIGNDEMFMSLVKIEKLKAKNRYRIAISGQYGSETLVSEKDVINIRLMAAKPRVSLNKKISISMKGNNPRTYFVSVDKIDGDKQTNVLNSSWDASLGGTTTLDSLKSGVKYQIKYWYICTQGVQSPVQTMDYQE